jgi:phage tail-like protein
MSSRLQQQRVRPLGGSSGWPTAAAQNVTVAAGGIALRALPDGPLGLNDPQDTLGGLIAPRWLALGAGESAYLVDSRGVVHYLDCISKHFVVLAGELGLPRDGRTDLAVDGHRLAVLEAEELHVYDLGSLARIAVLDIGTTAGVPIRSVAFGSSGALALDADGRLWRTTPTGWTATPISGTATSWRRLAVDLTGAIHVLAETDRGPVLVEVEPDGRRVAEVQDPREVATRFGPAPVRDAFGRFSVPFLPEPIERDPDAAAPEARDDPPAAVATHERSGSWTSGPIDSGIYRCRWHRIEIAVGALPAGTTVRVSTACAEEPGSQPSQGFASAATLRGPLLPGERTSPVAGDALIAQEGRYLWVTVDLGGDGLATPLVESVRLHYPRVSALDDLPAVFSADAESRELVERMLAVFQTAWEGLDATIDELPRYLDPATVPEGRTRDAALGRLAAWLAVRAEGDWSAGHLRRVLAAEGALAPRRGTLAALREAIALAVAGLPGAPSQLVPDLPAVVEGYTQRERLVLGSARTAGLMRAAPLAAASEEGRLRLGDDRLGKARVMAGPGSPEAELLARYAHRFSVSLPAAWVKSEAAERMLRRAIDGERPAHVAYDLCLVEPRLRVGVQSALGVDSVIAGPIRTVLAPADATHEPDPALRPPPSRPVHGRLGLDAVLVAIDDLPGGLPGVAGPGARRAGINAVLV